MHERSGCYPVWPSKAPGRSARAGRPPVPARLAASKWDAQWTKKRALSLIDALGFQAQVLEMAVQESGFGRIADEHMAAVIQSSDEWAFVEYMLQINTRTSRVKLLQAWHMAPRQLVNQFEKRTAVSPSCTAYALELK